MTGIEPVAAELWSVEEVGIFLDAGADVNVRSEDEWTLLIAAAAGLETAQNIQVLLDAGANVFAWLGSDDLAKLMRAAG